MSTGITFIIIIIIAGLLFFFFGFTNDHSVEYFEAESLSDCVLHCKDLMKKNMCLSTIPISTTRVNKYTSAITCECLLEDCVRKQVKQ